MGSEAIRRRRHARLAIALATSALLLIVPSAHAQKAALAPGDADQPAATPTPPSPASDQPPPSSAIPEAPAVSDWLQVGASLISESVTGTGDICPDKAREACILGSGGGVALRAGRRFASGVWIGGAYAFSRHDAANLIKLPILQQLRVEGRRYIRQGYRLSPYVMGTAGLGAYGSEWRAETFGPMISLGVGGEFELTQQVFGGISLAYRGLWLDDWVDSAGQSRGGLARMVGLELTLETRGRFERW